MGYFLPKHKPRNRKLYDKHGKRRLPTPDTWRSSHDWSYRFNLFRRTNHWQPTYAERILSFIGDLLYSLTFPFWLIKIFYENTIIIIKAIPEFIKSLPTLPFRMWSGFIRIIVEVFIEQNYLRIASFKDRLKGLIYFLIFSYFLLSFLEEAINYFAPTTYFYLKFVTEESFLVFFASILLIIIIWIVSFYFVDIYYVFRSYLRIFGYVFGSFVAAQIPALLFLVMFALGENFETPLSIYFIMYCIIVNEQTEEYFHNEGFFMMKYSWQRGHYLYKAQNATGAEKEIFEKEVLRWTAWDKHNSLYSAW